MMADQVSRAHRTSIDRQQRDSSTAHRVFRAERDVFYEFQLLSIYTRRWRITRQS